MKKKVSLIFICTLLSFEIFAQGHNSVFISYSSQLYFNKANVENDGRGFDPINTRNTYGHNIGLEFERTTKIGLILNVGLFYGSQTHDIIVDCDFTNFDPDAMINLKDVHFQRRIFVRNSYVQPRILVGYKKQISKVYSASAKIGLGVKLFSSDRPSESYYGMEYMTDDSTLIHSVLFGRDRIEIVNNGEKFRKRVRTFEYSIGVQRKINTKYVKYINIGIEGSIAWSNAKDLDKVWVITNDYRTADPTNASTDYYYNKHRSLGLRVALGF